MNPEACQDLLILSAAACSRRYPALLSPNISGNQPLRRKMRPLYIWSLESPVKALLKDPIAIHQQQHGFLSLLSIARKLQIMPFMHGFRWSLPSSDLDSHINPKKSSFDPSSPRIGCWGILRSVNTPTYLDWRVYAGVFHPTRRSGRFLSKFGYSALFQLPGPRHSFVLCASYTDGGKRT